MTGGIPPRSWRTSIHCQPRQHLVAQMLDARRIRALSVEQLEIAAATGHTLLPRESIVTSIREAKLEPPCPVYGDVFDAMNGEMTPEVVAALPERWKACVSAMRYTSRFETQ